MTTVGIAAGLDTLSFGHSYLGDNKMQWKPRMMLVSRTISCIHSYCIDKSRYVERAIYTLLSAAKLWETLLRFAVPLLCTPGIARILPGCSGLIHVSTYGCLNLQHHKEHVLDELTRPHAHAPSAVRHLHPATGRPRPGICDADGHDCKYSRTP